MSEQSDWLREFRRNSAYTIDVANKLDGCASEIDDLSARNELLVKVLGHCREKLELYRDHSDGQYHGGIEHTSLIKMIDTSIAACDQTEQ